MTKTYVGFNTGNYVLSEQAPRNYMNFVSDPYAYSRGPYKLVTLSTQGYETPYERMCDETRGCNYNQTGGDPSCRNNNRCNYLQPTMSNSGDAYAMWKQPQYCNAVNDSQDQLVFANGVKDMFSNRGGCNISGTKCACGNARCSSCSGLNMQDPLFGMQNPREGDWRSFDYRNGSEISDQECLSCQNKSFEGGEIDHKPLKKKMNF
jgi:hypothetical protein